MLVGREVENSIQHIAKYVGRVTNPRSISVPAVVAVLKASLEALLEVILIQVPVDI